MSIKHLFSIIMLLVVLQCTSKSSPQDVMPIEVRGTKWVYVIAPDVADTLKLLDTLYTYYSGEIDGYYYGRYEINNDTVYYDEIGEIWMYDPPEYVPFDNVEKWRGRAFLGSDGRLHYLSPLRYENGMWIESGGRSKDTYAMTKIE